MRTGLPWPPSRFGNVNNICVSRPAKARSAAKGTGRRKDRPVSKHTPTTLPEGFEVAQRAVKRLQEKYSSELELRSVHFNGRDTRVKGKLQAYGAARTKFERFMDRQTYWDWSWMQTSSDGEKEWKLRAPFRGQRYPASVFKGRKNVENDRRKCARDGCGESFEKRKNAKFCSLACKQMAYRRREGTEGHR